LNFFAGLVGNGNADVCNAESDRKDDSDFIFAGVQNVLFAVPYQYAFKGQQHELYHQKRDKRYVAAEIFLHPARMLGSFIAIELEHMELSKT
jgi:hypothetical protein